MVRYKLTCCDYIAPAAKNGGRLQICPICGKSDPILEEVKKSKHRKTLFIDIDGTLFKHQGPFSDIALKKPELNPGVQEKMDDWCSKEYNIILTTARREGLRAITESQLQSLGIPYDQLVMGIGKGERIIINDARPNGGITASSINLVRNEGFGDINI